MAKNKTILLVLALTLVLAGLDECAESNSTLDNAFEMIDYLSNNKNDFLNESKSTKRVQNLSLLNELKTISQNMEGQKFYKNLGQKMIIIISPFLLLLGGIGNPLCIVVLMRKRPANPTILYLCLLAAFDFLVLYTGLLRQYLKEVFNYDLRSTSTLNCKFHIFITYTFMQISSYLLVAVTVNRFTIMFNRTVFCKQKQIGATTTKKKPSVKSVYCVFGLICALVSLFNIHFLFYYDTLKQASKQSQIINDCTIDKSKYSSYYKFRTEIYGKLHLYLFIVVPCFILFIMNLLIIKKIMQSTKNTIKTKESKKRDGRKTALSIMLVSVCLWFMILKTPASVYITFPVQEMYKTYFPLAYNFFMLINYTNHAVNLILYLATSSSFRDEIKEFFCDIKNKLCPKKSKKASKDLIEIGERAKLNSKANHHAVQL